MTFSFSRHLMPLVIITSSLLFGSQKLTAEEPAAKVAPLKVLLVAGGCCHDYSAQAKLLKEGIEKRIRAEVTVELSESKTTDTTFPIYDSADWAKGYDVVIHDECSANVTERPYVDRILAAHRQGTPAVNLHCAMHSYRWGDYRSPVDPTADNGGWYQMLGVQSTGHGPKHPIALLSTNTSHPVMKGFEDWTTINEELYNNIRVYSGTDALIRGNQEVPPNKKALEKNPNAKPKEATAVVAWTNLYGPEKTRIFSTSLGHENMTVADDRYMDLVVRGILWTTNHLDNSGAPAADYRLKQ